MRDLADNDLPSVSFIVSAYNEESTIQRKIDNILSLDYPQDKLEIIIGSDGSDDNTDSIVERNVSRQLRFYPNRSRRGKMAVINDGVAVAAGDICVFSDVSEIFDRDAIRKLVRNFSDPSIGAVTGNHIFNPSADGLSKGVELYWKYQRWLQLMESRLASIISCDGTIYACRRELFQAPPVGTINDDKAVPWKILEQGKRIVFDPEAIARGDVLADTTRFFKQKIRGQAGMYQLFFLFRSLFVPRRPLVWFIFISHAVGPVMAPWFVLFLLITNIFLAAQMPYSLMLILQGLFYCGALFEIMAQRSRTHIPGLHIPYIFTISNIASLWAFWAFLFKIQKATWSKVE